MSFLDKKFQILQSVIDIFFACCDNVIEENKIQKRRALQ